MEEEKLYQLLGSLSIPVAYDHFINNEELIVEPPFILYRNDQAEQFKADDKIFYKNKQYIVDLITDMKDTVLENTLEELFNDNNLPWDKIEAYLDTEEIYQITYYI